MSIKQQRSSSANYKHKHMFFNKEQKFPITDEWLINRCVSTARHYCFVNESTGRFDVNKCLELATNEFKANYRSSRRLKPNVPLKPEHIEEMDSIYRRIWSSVEKEVREIVFYHSSKFKTIEITKVSAEGYVQAALAEAGINDFDITRQCHRLKITAVCPSGYKITFYVRYKDAVSRKDDGIFQKFKELLQVVESLPFQIKITK